MQQDVSAYYNQTQNHYRRWWKLNEAMSLHYGLWKKETRSFIEALQNTNQYMAGLAAVKGGNKILDAGCGVGGAAIFLAKNYDIQVTGVSLSHRQITAANENAKKHAVENLVQFEVADYTETNFADNSFDLIWACESSSSAPDKTKMAAEWHRLLKPGGRLILVDFFKHQATHEEGDHLLQKWSDLWAMSPLVTIDELTTTLQANNFVLLHQAELTEQIIPTIHRMYKSYLWGRVPAKLYNLFFKAQKYSRHHYKSGLYQYKAYKEGLWNYHALLAQKSDF